MILSDVIETNTADEGQPDNNNRSKNEADFLGPIVLQGKEADQYSTCHWYW